MANEETTFYETPKDDPKDRIQVEIGDSKQPEFQPQIKMMRFDNEVNLSVRLVDHGEDFTPQIDGNGTVICEGEKVRIEQYQIEPNEAFPEGASEFQIDLLERPESNVIKFSINTKGLNFHYQPELTPEEVKRGDERPENVVGSYAVYFDTVRLNLEGGKKYRCGKAFHWYRPQIEDANGVKIWGDLNVDVEAGEATVTIPQEFLEKAAYPVRHAAGATIGYTSIGGSSQTVSSTRAAASYAVAAAAGIVSKISIYSGSTNFGTNVKGVTWRASDGAILTNGVSGSVSLGNPGWFDATYSSSPTFTAAAHYFGFVTDNSVSSRYDLVTNGGDLQLSGQDYTTPATFSGGLGNGYAFSVYATYTLAPNAYTLACSQGSYSLTGQATALKAGRKLVAAQGSYSLTGQSMIPKRGLKSACDQGSYAVNGQVLNFKRGLKATMSQGSYAVAGQNVAFNHGYKTILDQGSYSVAGQDVNFRRALQISLAQGSYAVVGVNVDAYHGAKLVATQGSYSVTGQSVALNRGLKVALTQGGYVLTGQDLTPKRGLKLAIDQGSYGVTGFTMGFDFAKRLVTDCGFYSLTGNDLITRRSLQFPLGQGSYALTGQNAQFNYGRRVSLDQGSYATTGQTLNLKRSLLVSLAQGSYSMTGQDMTPKRGVRLAMAQGAYVLTGQNLAFSGVSRRMYPNQGSYIYSGQIVNLNRGVRVALVAGNYALTGQNALLKANRRLYANQGSYVLTGIDLNVVRSSLRITLGQGSYNLTGFPVGLTYAAVYAYPLHLTISTGHQYLELDQG